MIEKMTALSMAAVLGAFLAGCGGGQTREAKLADEYDALAKEILKAQPNESEALNQKEKAIMKSLLMIYRTDAETAFAAAKAATGDAQMEELKKGMEAVTKLAREGDNRIEGIKKDLQKGGHHFSKAEGSDEEYIIITPKAKKALMEDVNKLRALVASGKQAAAAEIDAIANDVFANVDPALKG